MIDCSHWYGLKFPDLDTPHWLPYLTEVELGQASPKLTMEQDHSRQAVDSPRPARMAV